MVVVNGTILAPKSIDIFSYLIKSHCCLDQSESKLIISISGCSLQAK
jgi:hypothetical protein